MKTVVTGASGFIGSHLVGELLAAGHDVGVVTRNRDVAHNVRLMNYWPKLMVFESDLRHRDSLQRIMGWKPDVVFHLAAFNHVGESFRQVEECYTTNALGSANLLDVVDGMARVVYMSSSEVYGHQEMVPWRETMGVMPKSPYAITKYAGELHARMLQRLGHPVRIVRAFNTYGPGQSEKAVIPDLIMKALMGVRISCTPGDQTREFNYVGDIVRGLRMAGEHEQGWEGPINLGCGKEVAIKDLVTMIHMLCGRKGELGIGDLPARPNEIMRMAADNKRAEVILGWKPGVPLSAGLAQTIAEFKRGVK